MADSNAARRWALALMELAAEDSVEDAVERDLDGLVSLLGGGGREILSALGSPVFDKAERQAVLGAVLARLAPQELTTRFLSLLVDRGRASLLPEIAAVYRARSDERAGRLRVQVTTVEPLSAELAAELKATFARSTGRTIVLEERVDTALLGGLVARIGGRVYDASLRTRLEDLKRRLVHAQVLPEA